MPASTAQALAAAMWAGLDGDPGRLRRLRLHGDGALESVFAVSDFAAAAVGVAALAADELAALAPAPTGAGETRVEVDRRLAAMSFGSTLRPIGWQPPPLRDALTGDYAARDGWIRLHANARPHRDAAYRVLGLPADAGAAQAAPRVAQWRADALEQAVVDAGGCAASMRAMQAWREHPQGAALQRQPLVLRETSPAPPARWSPSPGRPLRGLRVLDLTRVLAGPVATRMLAALGATVLRIDAPDWDEPGVVPEVSVGKLCARLDLKTPHGLQDFIELLAHADVFVHGLRPGALDALGLDAAARARIRPGLVDVSLDAWGWDGPWARRRGFDSLVQMSCAIAEAGMRWRGAARPVPLPVQALDHATGYLMAAAALRALCLRVRGDGATRARLSLARSAWLLLGEPQPAQVSPHAAPCDEDLAEGVEHTAWGPARRLRMPWRIPGIESRWELPAAALGSSPARWPARSG